RAKLYQLGYMVDVPANSSDAENFAVRLAGFRRGLIGRAQFRVFQLAGNAHGAAEVVRADQQDIDTGQSGDGVGVRNAFRRFQHGNQRCCGISLLVDLAKGDLTVALQRTGAGDRTFAQWRKAASAYKCLGLIARAYIRADDTKRTGVEQTRGIVELV